MHEMGWTAFREGATVGQSGPEGGVIIRDEEHPSGARLLLERACLRAPFAITASVYGWAEHTRFIADEPSAMHAFDLMKPALAEIVSLTPTEDDPEADQKADAVTNAVAIFIERFP